MGRKPTVQEIRDAPRLFRDDVRDPLSCCNVCGEPSAQLGAWRAHDDRDHPMPGPHALVFIGQDHRPCIKRMEDHPRLYGPDAGVPGSLPLLCGPCKNRDGLRCLHPDLKANGGAGLKVTMRGFGAGMIVCGRGKCWSPPREAVSCDGRTLLGVVP